MINAWFSVTHTYVTLDVNAGIPQAEAHASLQARGEYMQHDRSWPPGNVCCLIYSPFKLEVILYLTAWKILEAL